MWFWTPRSDIWAPDTHGVGWRLRPLDRRLRVNLTVINLAQDAEVTETFVVEFDDNEGLAAFHQLTDAL